MARAKPRIPTPTVAGVRAGLARAWYPREFLVAICFFGALGMGSVWGFSRLGEPLWRIRSPEGLTNTNLAFGGPDNRRLYITESQTGCILTADLMVPGKTMFSHD